MYKYLQDLQTYIIEYNTYRIICKNKNTWNIQNKNWTMY